MVYTKQTWQDNTAPPNGQVSAARLNYLEEGVETAQETADGKVTQPVAGVTVVQQFVYVDPTVARPTVPAYVSLNWVGPAGGGGAPPTNMAANDMWDMQV